MLKTINLGLQYGSRKLFEHVDLQFSKGNCYGVIGANGAGKSTFLKLLSGEIESTSGQVIIGPNERMSILKQNQNAYDNETVMRTVLSGHKRLIEIIDEKEFTIIKLISLKKMVQDLLNLKVSLLNLMDGMQKRMLRHCLMV